MLAVSVQVSYGLLLLLKDVWMYMWHLEIWEHLAQRHVVVNSFNVYHRCQG